MTYDEMIQMLGDLRERQLAGEHLPCPRCGVDIMKSSIHTNALSRQADIYICDLCGLDEALDAFKGKPWPLGKWACFQAK